MISHASQGQSLRVSKASDVQTGLRGRDILGEKVYASGMGRVLVKSNLRSPLSSIEERDPGRAFERWSLYADVHSLMIFLFAYILQTMEQLSIVLDHEEKPSYSLLSR